jgi:hypothetical protein
VNVARWIHGISHHLLRAAFCEYFGVGGEHADVLCVLYGRPGEYVPMRKMRTLLNAHRPPNRQAVYERVRVLREIMEPESLISGGQLDDLGYALSEIGFDECQKALSAMAEVLTRAGPAHGIPALIEAEEQLRALPPPKEAAA